MAMCRTYQTLLQKLQEGERTIEKDGLRIRVRPVPDTDKLGTVDARVKYVSETSPPFGSGASLEETRNSMGWNNVDVSEPGIRTIYRNILGEAGDIPVRIYKTSGDEAKGCIIFFHGGGFFGGSLKTVENPCKILAERINGIVVSVDYRLAPENPFPAGFDDCFTAVKWIYDHAEEIGVDQNKLGVSGDSAGGNMAAVCALKDRDQHNNMIRYQALIYPTVNVGANPCPGCVWNIDEYEACDEDKALSMQMAKALGRDPDNLVNLYLGGDRERAKHNYVSPLLAEDLSGLADTLIINAEYDFLRVECEAYGRKLQKFGNQVDMLRYCGMDHAFMDKLGDYPQAEDCMNEIAKGFLKTMA